jgi:hypothetical protein
MTATNLGQRIAALPPAAQSVISHFLEYLEWKEKLPVYKGAGAEASDAYDRRALGRRLHVVRETLKQTLDEAAYVAGLSLTTYEAYEGGKIGRWATRKMLSYCDTWNVSLDWLLEGAGTMFRDDRRPDIKPMEVAPKVRGRRGPRGPYKTRSVAEIEHALCEARRYLAQPSAADRPASNVIDFAERARRAKEGGEA